MNITFVLPSIDLVGGVRVVFEYANRLQKKGHNIHIIYPLIPFAMTPQSKMRKLILQTYTTSKNFKGKGNIAWFDLEVSLIQLPTLNVTFLKYFEKLIPEADIIIATSWETAYTVNALQSNKGIKVYFVQHYEIWDIWNDEECWQEIENRFDYNSLSMADVNPHNQNLLNFKNMVDATYKLPFKKIVISNWLNNIIEQKFGLKVDDMTVNGTNFDVFYKEEKVIKDNKVRILMPSRTSKWKGTEDGIRALEIVKKIHPEIEFTIYGLDKSKRHSTWINYQGRVSDDELRRLYTTSDIFVFPSWVEGFGLPPMEAMACGCAVVATDVGAIRDYSENEKSVLIVPPRKPELLAKNIIRLVENPTERQRIAGNAHLYIRKYSWEKATNELEEILQKYIQ